MSTTTSGIAQRTDLALRALVGAAVALAHRVGVAGVDEVDDQHVALLVDVDGDLVGRLAGEHAPERDARRASGRRAGSRRSPGCAGAAEAEARRRASCRGPSRPPVSRSTGAEARRARPATACRRRPGGAAAAPRRAPGRAAAPSSSVARRAARQHEQVDAHRGPARVQQDPGSSRRPRERFGGVVAEREQRLGPQAGGEDDEREHGDERLLRPRRSAARSARRARSRTGRSGRRRRTTARCRGRAGPAAAGLPAAARKSSSLPTNPAAGGTPATLSAPSANTAPTSAPRICDRQEQQRLVERVDDGVEDRGGEADRRRRRRWPRARSRPGRSPSRRASRSTVRRETASTPP